MRKLTILTAGLGLALCSSIAFADDHSGDPHWIRDDSRSGCWIYNLTPQSNEAIVWTGPNCSYGQEANGQGTVTWFQNNQWVSAEQGAMQGGIMQGCWVRRYANGNLDEANWVDGIRQEPQETTANDNSSGGSYGGGYDAPTNSGDAYLETLKRQNRENCARAAQGYDIACHDE